MNVHATLRNESGLQPSAFHNVVPQSREQKRVLKDKESLEKQRLAQRKEKFIRIDASAGGNAMVQCDPQSQGYIREIDRFHSDFAADDKIIRDRKRDCVRAAFDEMRNKCVQKEVERWKDLDVCERKEQEKWKEIRVNGLKSKRNKSGEAYDVITLRYNDGKDGQRLREAGDRIKNRAVARARNMQFHSSREGINPITGQSLRTISLADLFPSDT